MTIELTTEMEAIVTDRMRSGRYSSAEAVIEEALRAVQVRHDPTRVAVPNDFDSPSSREERSKSMKDLFARVDAEGGFEFEIERHNSPQDEREPW